MKKILLVYASKTGTTQDAALEVAKRLSVPTDFYNCKDERFESGDMTKVNMKPYELNWDSYELIIIGTAMYIGSPLKEIKAFCKKYQDKLIHKGLSFFTCGVGTETEDKAYLWKCLPKEVSQKILLYRHLGGEIREDRLSTFSRFAMREYVKQHEPALGINQSKINEFCTELAKLIK